MTGIGTLGEKEERNEDGTRFGNGNRVDLELSGNSGGRKTRSLKLCNHFKKKVI